MIIPTNTVVMMRKKIFSFPYAKAAGATKYMRNPNTERVVPRTISKTEMPKLDNFMILMNTSFVPLLKMFKDSLIFFDSALWIAKIFVRRGIASPSQTPNIVDSTVNRKL
jgi:hypothetical protein